MSRRIAEAIRNNKYAAEAVMGKTRVLVYSGRNQEEFRDSVLKNAYVNIICYIDSRPVHKERVLGDSRTW